MANWPAIDSRRYIVAFELNSASDCPPDFDLRRLAAGFQAGLFLPRADPDWFGRSKFPPRVLMLSGGALHIVAHPGAEEAAAECRLDRAACAESGHMLLKGWLRFTGPGFERRLEYNTRGLPAVNAFLRKLRQAWLRDSGPRGAAEARFGGELDIKFGNALEAELDPGERAALQFFAAPEEVRTNRWIYPRRRWRAGDLIAFTDRRALWITDRENGGYSRYGSIASYAPWHELRKIELADGQEPALRLQFEHGVWNIPAPRDGLRRAQEFIDSAQVWLSERRALLAQPHRGVDP